MATLSEKNMAMRRRAEARREIIANTLRLQTLTEAKPDPADEMWWSERGFIEARNAELEKVIAETHQVQQEALTP